jgi:transcriptional regulator with XRE-family HTH domain
MAPIYDEIRQAIADSDISRYRIWQETGISQGHLSEFMAGTKGLSVEALEALADYLGLVVTVQLKNIRKNTKPGKRGR